MRKCGGSAVRKEIANSSVHANLSYFVACEEHFGGDNLVRRAVQPDAGREAWRRGWTDERHMQSCHNYGLQRLLGSTAAGRSASVFAAPFFWEATLRELGVLRGFGRAVPYGRSRPRVSCLVLVLSLIHI